MLQRTIHLPIAGLALALCLWAATPAPAQREAPALPSGSISGAVVDGAAANPIPAARVVLEPAAGGLVTHPGGAGFLEATRSVATGPSGAYRFSGLPPGRYRLHVTREGYRPASVTVELRGSADSRVSIALDLEPIPLEPLEVKAQVPDPYGRTRSDPEDVGSGRIAAARLRQRTSLSTDVRELTHADVQEAVTLGETDVLRALQRLPGVSTHDDYTAELWTRGAPWDQTRVYFDGLPLFNPVHGVGALSGFGPSAIGAAWLHPGVRPASLGEGAAGVLDLRTRRGTGTGELNGLADLSLASAALSLDQRVLGGRGAWMLSGRRSHLDWLTGGIEKLVDEPGIHVPYAFSDLVGRADLRIGEERTLEVSGITAHDRISGDIPDVLHGTRASWGNSAGRVTFEAPLGPVRGRHTAGISRYGSTVREGEPDPSLPYGAPRGDAGESELLYAFLGGELAPRDPAAPLPGWSAGYQLVHQSAAYEGAAPEPRAGTGVNGPLLRSDRLGMGVLWGERTWSPGARLTAQGGLRLEAGGRVRNGGVLRAAPRASLRYRLHPEVALSAAAGRTFQYTQALAPAGPRLGIFYPGHLWLLAGDEVPALRADVATLGAEAWLGGTWLVAANGYVRRATGVAVPDPTPGPAAGRPLFVAGESLARGVELSARRLAGRWTGSASYTYGVSEVEAAGLRYPAAQDRRHTVDASAMLRAGGSLRLGAAFTGATGAPFTRVFSGDPVQNEQGEWVENPRFDLPHAARAPTYASLDLLVDWSRTFGRWEAGAYLQLSNVLGRDNAARYDGSYIPCGGRWGGTCTGSEEVYDHFEQGIPLLPLLGARIRF